MYSLSSLYAFRSFEFFVVCANSVLILFFILDIFSKLSFSWVAYFFAIISKAPEWKEIESFARKEEKWLKKYLELPNGIPSHDTIQRVISILDSKVLYENCLKYFIEI